MRASSRVRVLSAVPTLAREVGVLVADDCDELRQLICANLRRTGGIGVVVEASRAMQTLVQAAWYRPDVVMLDFDLDGADPDRLIRDLAAQVPTAALVGFSGYDTDFLRPTARAMLSLHLDKRTPMAEVCTRVLEIGRAQPEARPPRRVAAARRASVALERVGRVS